MGRWNARVQLAAMLVLASCARDVDVIWADSIAGSGSGGSESGDGTGAVPSAGVCATPADVRALEPGHWCEAPSSHLRDVVPCDGKRANLERGNDCDPALGITQEHYNSFAHADPAQIVWSNSAVVDTVRDRLVLWGGKSGTTQWAGNEIYSFDLAAFAWSRETDPPFLTAQDDTPQQESTGYYVDGTPRARKSHNTLTYLESIESLCALGAVELFRDRSHLPNTDCYSFRDRAWRRYDDLPAVSKFPSIAMLHPARGTALLLDAIDGDLYEFDPTRPAGSQWVVLGSGGRRNGGTTAVLDPVGDRVFSIGLRDDGEIEVFEPDGSGGYAPRLANASGDLSAVAAKWPGLAFDPSGQRIIAWIDGAEAYALDPDTLVFTELRAAGSNDIVVQRTVDAGYPMGRFRYVADLEAFVVINDVDHNVAFYRPPDPS